jgi:hypothetical protein
LLVSNLWHVPSLNLWISMAWWSQMIQFFGLGTTGRLSEWSRHPRDQSKAWLGTPRWKMARLLLVDLKEHPLCFVVFHNGGLTCITREHDCCIRHLSLVDFMHIWYIYMSCMCRSC